MTRLSEITHDPARISAPSVDVPGDLRRAYECVRSTSMQLCAPLAPEDCVIQSMPDVSPTRWHLAHTTWFFETFVLRRAIRDYASVDPAFDYLFNSYYNAVGEQFPRPQRGVLSRPTLQEVFAYRGRVDERMQALFEKGIDPDSELAKIIEIGLHHEQQHQELILTDIKHVFAQNPLFPAYRDAPLAPVRDSSPMCWLKYAEGLRWIGHDGVGFCYDNELPRHRVFEDAFELADRLVTNAEYLAFIEDGGYRRPELWLSDGWSTVCQEGWSAPLYWRRGDDGISEFTLSGLHEVDPGAPVCHVSYYEADAFARWAGAELPTESAWEHAVSTLPVAGNLMESAHFHPLGAPETAGGDRPRQMYGDVWEWTASPYVGYPGYRPPEGALGEYNGKFMCNQIVLRGGSCATPLAHIRATYRNFFPPSARWQFSGIRLARRPT